MQQHPGLLYLFITAADTQCSVILCHSKGAMEGIICQSKAYCGKDYLRISAGRSSQQALLPGHAANGGLMLQRPSASARRHKLRHRPSAASAMQQFAAAPCHPQQQHQAAPASAFRALEGSPSGTAKGCRSSPITSRCAWHRRRRVRALAADEAPRKGNDETEDFTSSARPAAGGAVPTWTSLHMEGYDPEVRRMPC